MSHTVTLGSSEWSVALGSEMLRGVYPECNEWAQHDSADFLPRQRPHNIWWAFLRLMRIKADVSALGECSDIQMNKLNSIIGLYAPAGSTFATRSRLVHCLQSTQTLVRKNLLTRNLNLCYTFT